MSHPRIVLLALALLAVAGLAPAQDHPNLERGFFADQAYQLSNIDSVNLYNGNLTLALPIGQRYHTGGNLSWGLTLYYNSNVWDFSQEDFWLPHDGGSCTEYDGIPEVTFTVAQPVAGANAGLGWTLSLGALDGPYGQSDSPNWVYTSPDGSKHVFFSTLHDLGDATQQRTEPPCSPSAPCNISYTRDNTYLRLVAIVDSCGKVMGGDVEFPDGTVEHFDTDNGACCPSGCADTAQLKTISDQFGNTLSVTYPSGNWQLSDGIRTTTVYMTSGLHGPHVDYIDVAAFGSPTATARYQFHYTTASICRSCKQDDITGYCFPPGKTTTVNLLMGITLPDGSSYSMNSDSTTFSGTPWYNTSTTGCSGSGCTISPKDLPGTLQQVQLPPGGTIAWTYGAWAQDPAGGACPSGCTPTSTCSPSGWPTEAQESTGVYQRTVCDPVGSNVCGTWTYGHESPAVRNAAGAPNEARTTVTSPDGDDTVYYFRAQSCFGVDTGASPHMPYGWDYSLPFTKNQADGESPPKYLSTQFYQGTGATRTLRRSVYVSYDSDVNYLACCGGSLQAPSNPEYWYLSNRRLAGQRTVYNDDSNTYADVGYSVYDFLGHFRSATTGGNFASGNTRTTFMDFNPTHTHYAINWNGNDPWVLGTFDYRTEAESGQTAEEESCFNTDTGALLRSRILASGTSEGVTDLLTVLSYDAHGNVATEQYYGGDTLAQALGTGSLCTLSLPTNAQYRIDHEYPYLDPQGHWVSTPRRSRHSYSSGASVGFYDLDLDLDQNTLLPSASRDTAGIQTNFTYDNLGRLTTSQPTAGNGAWLRNEYTPWSGSPMTPAAVASCAKPNGVTSSCSSTSDSLAASAVQLDGLGRTYLAQHLLPDTTCVTAPCLSQQITTYTGIGWRNSVSEWQPPNSALKVTSFGYQYLSNPADPNSGLVSDPFGRVGSITRADGTTNRFSYTGARQASRGAYVSGQWSVTTETYDRQGRLWSVQEPSGGAHAQYDYDVGSRLATVTMTGGSTGQSRAFTYDNRGFLTQETLPELGASGNGTIQYPMYDARGHALEKYDGVTHLLFSYDPAEHLSQVQTTDGSWSPTGTVRAYAFDGSNGNGYSNGKLITAVGTTSFDSGTAVVTERYTYGGLAGAVSTKITEVNVTGTSNGNFDPTFSQSFTWNDLGQLASQTYPGASGITTGRSIYNTYTAGLLTGVLPYYAPSIKYNANGTLGTVVHSNGVSDTIGADPNAIGRPSSIATSGATLPGGGSGDWSTGNYGYDGSGNITAMGGDTFSYDLLSRLKNAYVAAYGAAEAYDYDPYGNLKTYGSRSLSSDAATNRLNEPLMSALYDNAGNLWRWTETGSGATYTLGYTPLNQLSSVSGGALNRRLAYTAGGERVLVRDGAAPASTMITLRELDGQVVSEIVMSSASSPLAWSKDYVYRGGLLLSSVSATGGLRHYALDHLGSPRLATNRCGGQSYLYKANPFGKDPDAVAQDSERMRYTIHERDIGDTSKTADDIDNMHARSYMPFLGRFVSADLMRGSPNRPQSLNLFAYGDDSPLNRVDPLGLTTEIPCPPSKAAPGVHCYKEGITVTPGGGDGGGSITWTIDPNPGDVPAPLTFIFMGSGGPGGQTPIWVDYAKRSRFILDSEKFHTPCAKSFGDRVTENMRITNDSIVSEVAYLAASEVFVAPWVEEQTGFPSVLEGFQALLGGGMEINGVYQSGPAALILGGMNWGISGAMVGWGGWQVGVGIGSAVNAAMSPCDFFDGL